MLGSILGSPHFGKLPYTRTLGRGLLSTLRNIHQARRKPQNTVYGLGFRTRTSTMRLSTNIMKTFDNGFT